MKRTAIVECPTCNTRWVVESNDSGFFSGISPCKHCFNGNPTFFKLYDGDTKEEPKKMKIKDLTQKDIKVGMRIRSLADYNKIGTIIKIDVDDDYYAWVSWQGESSRVGFYGTNCNCEIVEEEPKKMNEDKNPCLDIPLPKDYCKKPYFDGVKVGDKVWSIEYGWGVIHKLLSSNRVEYIRVDFPNNQTYNEYYLNGKRNSLATTMQTLFWDEVKFEAPKKPEKWVEKKGETATLYEPVEVWRVVGGEKKRKVTKVTETYYMWEEIES